MLVNKSIYFYLLASVILGIGVNSCQGLNDQYVELSNEYWYRSTSETRKVIESRVLAYHNKVYPKVIDYSFNNDFIIAEQKPQFDATITEMGEDLFRRFEHYRMYKNDTNILNTDFYKKLRGIVEKDSNLYNTFISMHASDNELENRKIAVILAERKVKSIDFNRITNNTNVNFWIVVHSNNSLIGPFTKTQYLITKDSLRIPESLRLKFEKQANQ